MVCVLLWFLVNSNNPDFYSVFVLFCGQATPFDNELNENVHLDASLMLQPIDKERIKEKHLKKTNTIRWFKETQVRKLDQRRRLPQLVPRHDHAQVSLIPHANSHVTRAGKMSRNEQISKMSFYFHILH